MPDLELFGCLTVGRVEKVEATWRSFPPIWDSVSCQSRETQSLGFDCVVGPCEECLDTDGTDRCQREEEVVSMD